MIRDDSRKPGVTPHSSIHVSRNGQDLAKLITVPFFISEFVKLISDFIVRTNMST